MNEWGIHMEKNGMIGVNLGERNFQLHGVCEDGPVAFWKNVSRARFLSEVSEHGPRAVAMGACGSAATGAGACG